MIISYILDRIEVPLGPVVSVQELMQQVRRLQIRTRRQVSDVLSGAYLSVFKGSGVEFDEVRPYVPGDDVRSIDWNVTARTGVPHIKRFVEERDYRFCSWLTFQHQWIPAPFVRNVQRQA